MWNCLLSLSGRNRRVLFDEFALLQLRPEIRRDLDLHGAVVSDDLLLTGGADNQGRGDIRRCRELQRRRPKIDAVPSRYLAQLFALFDDRLRDLVVFLAVIVPLTAADEAGVERRTNHERNALGARGRKNMVERVLVVDQRILGSEQADIWVCDVQQFHDRFRPVHAEAPALDGSFLPHLRESREGTLARDLELLLPWRR